LRDGGLAARIVDAIAGRLQIKAILHRQLGQLRAVAAELLKLWRVHVQLDADDIQVLPRRHAEKNFEIVERVLIGFFRADEAVFVGKILLKRSLHLEKADAPGGIQIARPLGQLAGTNVFEPPVADLLLASEEGEILRGDGDNKLPAKIFEAADLVDELAFGADERLEIDHARAAEKRNGAGERQRRRLAADGVVVQSIDERD